jgi:hypothetical protein
MRFCSLQAPSKALTSHYTLSCSHQRHPRQHTSVVHRQRVGIVYAHAPTAPSDAGPQSKFPSPST